MHATHSHLPAPAPVCECVTQCVAEELLPCCTVGHCALCRAQPVKRSLLHVDSSYTIHHLNNMSDVTQGKASCDCHAEVLPLLLTPPMLQLEHEVVWSYSAIAFLRRIHGKAALVASGNSCTLHASSRCRADIQLVTCKNLIPMKQALSQMLALQLGQGLRSVEQQDFIQLGSQPLQGCNSRDNALTRSWVHQRT